MKKINYYFVVGIFNNGDREFIDRTLYAEEAIYIAKSNIRFYNQVIVKFKDEIIFSSEKEIN